MKRTVTKYVNMNPRRCMACFSTLTKQHYPASSAFRTKIKSFFAMVGLLLLTFAASAITGIGLHVAGHGTNHEVWHNWAVAHTILSFVWLVSGAFHIKRHWSWYKAVISKGIGKRSRTTLVLSMVFIVVVITGIVLIACVDGANSAVGMWHYRLGVLLILLSVVHLVKRTKI